MKVVDKWKSDFVKVERSLQFVAFDYIFSIIFSNFCLTQAAAFTIE